MKTILFTLTLLFSVVLIPNVATAQMRMQCVPYEQTVNNLLTQFGEVPHYRGIEKSGKAMVEVWANLESGTFTIMRVVHLPPGKAICATIHGEAFYKLEDDEKPEIPLEPKKSKKDENKT